MKEQSILPYVSRIEKLDMESNAKNEYCWLLANFDCAKRIAENKKLKTIGDFRNALYKEIGFAPALLFSFKHLFESPETFVSALEKSFKK